MSKSVIVSATTGFLAGTTIATIAISALFKSGKLHAMTASEIADLRNESSSSEPIEENPYLDFPPYQALVDRIREAQKEEEDKSVSVSVSIEDDDDFWF